MNNYILGVTVLITIIGYVSQSLKIYKNRSSSGVSLGAYIISLITVLSVSGHAESEHLVIASFVEAACILFTLSLIRLYSDKANKHKFGWPFWFSLFLSFFMIRGVMQAVTSYGHSGKSNVSISGYVTWITLNMCLIVLAENNYVTAALLCTTMVFLYIIAVTYIQNRTHQLEVQR